jgi:RHS repeat-associated protein
MHFLAFSTCRKHGRDYNITSETGIAQKYKYQEQERQDEIGLNWDNFKWRNYDYAIGRFMCFDPVTERYEYNSPYAFQENKMGLGRELEGLKLNFFFEDAYVNTGSKHFIDWFRDKEPIIKIEAKASIGAQVGV